jgi:hypothetical protein
MINAAPILKGSDWIKSGLKSCSRPEIKCRQPFMLCCATKYIPKEIKRGNNPEANT